MPFHFTDSLGDVAGLFEIAQDLSEKFKLSSDWIQEKDGEITH